MRLQQIDTSSSRVLKATKSQLYEGFGSPEGIVTGSMGDRYINLNGGANTTYYSKESGFNTNTGWSAVGAGGSAGWANEQIFVSTDDQTEFTVTEFTFSPTSKITVLINGIDQDEGGGFDWVRNVALNKIILNNSVTGNARVKIKLW